PLGRRLGASRRLEPGRGDGCGTIALWGRRRLLFRPLVRRRARAGHDGARPLHAWRDVSRGGGSGPVPGGSIPSPKERNGGACAPRRSPGSDDGGRGGMRDDFMIYPAIDLRRGGAVRLRQGSAAEEKRYSENPTSIARAFAEAGARSLHVVDLDGAFEGKPRHFAEVVRIARVAAVPVRFRGGPRTEEDLASAFAAGVAVAIVGTVAIRDPELLAGWISRFGPRLAVSLDVRDGMARTHGWTESTGDAFENVASTLGKTGLTDLIVTDVARDGELSGPNPGLMARAAEA